MKENKRNKFEALCKRAEAETGVSVQFFDSTGTPDGHIAEDDGNLHITKAGLHACFDVGEGQSLEAAQQNTRTKSVLTFMKLEKHIGEKTLLEEEPSEDDECPYCHRSYN